MVKLDDCTRITGSGANIKKFTQGDWTNLREILQVIINTTREKNLRKKNS